jgi:hypothetical protein
MRKIDALELDASFGDLIFDAFSAEGAWSTKTDSSGVKNIS